MIFTPFKIGNKEFKNRLIMTGINTGFTRENQLSDKIKQFYIDRVKGGASAIVTPCAVNKAGSFNNMPYNSETYPEFCKGISDLLEAENCLHIVQLFHYGSGTSVAEKRVEFLPENMTVEMIRDIVNNFAQTAEIATRNGADVIEIDCANGYLLSEFISPITNKRTDNYGGIFENRIGLPIEVMSAVRRKVLNNVPVILKISGAEMVDGGYTISDMVNFVKIACEKNLIDAVEITGGLYNSSIPWDTYFVDYEFIGAMADTIKRNVDIPVIAEGRLIKKSIGENMLKKAMVDFLGIGKSFVADANIGLKLMEDKSYNICQGCNKCMESIFASNQLVCAYNPEVGFEYEEKKHRKIATAKKLVVVGGGPAGMMSAKKSAERGYKTILITDEDKLGGQFNMACLPYKKDGIKSFVDNLENELNELGVEVVYNTKADFSLIKSYEPYFVVLAMGSKPIIPRVFKGHNYILAKDVFLGSTDILEKVKKGKTVIIGGGSLGLEVADYINKSCCLVDDLEAISKYGHIDINDLYLRPDITIIEKNELGIELNSTKNTVINSLINKGVNILQGVEVCEVLENNLILSDDSTVEYDNIIIASGLEPVNTDMSEELMGDRISYAIIGDAESVCGGDKAIREGFELFLRLFIA
ncbi:MAG: FAD-dependent oxidoreductase [Tyzzerella sp.]|uniref:FAD-dependent oxidoreductase n=1 Tax=Candidatus Fimicola merdigallinarum TaxID=2840819 RepID=A0A9D9DTK1_9FIRM|nr:FAD-dependent oxidoreductase [Candidatus Fimicola merdigallinarum]